MDTKHLYKRNFHPSVHLSQCVRRDSRIIENMKNIQKQGHLNTLCCRPILYYHFTLSISTKLLTFLKLSLPMNPYVHCTVVYFMNILFNQRETDRQKLKKKFHQQRSTNLKIFVYRTLFPRPKLALASPSVQPPALTRTPPRPLWPTTTARTSRARRSSRLRS